MRAVGQGEWKAKQFMDSNLVAFRSPTAGSVEGKIPGKAGAKVDYEKAKQIFIIGGACNACHGVLVENMKVYE
jgi:hypothetical protein